MLLSDLKIEEGAVVKKINCADKVRKRLNNMGLTVGVKIKLVRFAPLGDPLEINVRDFYMAIRKNQAREIEVKPL